MKEPVTYIIGVHGIGEQRKNENILPIINGFARVRQAQYDSENSHQYTKVSDGTCPLTQGMLSSQQANTPWIEFENISSQAPNNATSKIKNSLANNANDLDSTEHIDKHEDKTGKRHEDKTLRFLGHTVDECDLGKNFRFVDLHWADVMQSHLDIAGQSVETWTQALIDRLKLRDLDKDEQYGWIPQLLISMRRGILPVKSLFDLKQRLLTGTQNQFNDAVFNRFLGDAQLYGEYRTTRDQAVFRFHKTLAKVHAAHCAEQDNNPNLGEPRYIILGHSLGTIMSFDALLYAHGANKPNENDPSQINLDLAQLDLRMYCDLKDDKQGENLPDLSWIRYVDTFISLGSPIDKYLILWWTNYKHLIDKTWLDPSLVTFRKKTKDKIKHYNYCDEQDPVGHELDTAYTADVVKALFEKEEDIVFMRYGTPGVAHIKYWDDVPLLHHIMQTAIDKTAIGKETSDTSNKTSDAIIQRTKEITQANTDEPIPETLEKEVPKKAKAKTKDNEMAKIKWFKPMAYASTLFWSYAAIPVLGLIFASLFFMLGHYSIVQHEHYVSGILSFIASAVIFYIMLRGMSLMIAWRQLMRETRESKHATKNDNRPTETSEKKDETSLIVCLIKELPKSLINALLTLIITSLQFIINTLRSLIPETHKKECNTQNINCPKDDPEENLIKNQMALSTRMVIFTTPFIWLLIIIAYHHYLTLNLSDFWSTYLYVLSTGAFILSTLNMFWFAKMKWYLAPEKLLHDCLDNTMMKLSKRFPRLKRLIGIKKKKALVKYLPKYVPQKYSLNFHDYICCKDQTRSSNKKPKGCGKCKGNGDHAKNVEKSQLLK